MRASRLMGLSPVLMCIAAAPANPPAQAVAQANTSAVQAVPSSVTPSAPPATEEPKICKPLPSSYTRLPDRACLTKKQWDQLDKQLQEDR